MSAEARVKELEKLLLAKEKELESLRKKKWHDYIDDFVEKWYNENNEQVDIGLVKCGPFTVDVMPDYVEKELYKKSFKIMFSLLKDLTNSEHK
jgi:hypothetical protein